MFGPGEYRPDPSEGITVPADLPQPEIVSYSRNDLRQPCPRCGHSAYRDKQSYRTLHDLGNLDMWCPRDLLVKAEREEGGSVRLSVKDAGVGLEPQAIERLFDAFYTTKSDGMGIGLSVSRSIIEGHGGKMWAVPNQEHGATFSFSIPQQTESAGALGIADTVQPRPTRGAHDVTRNA